MKNNGNNHTLGEYYIGLDVGTNSVGWAVTDQEYNVARFHGNAMWGVRMYEDAQSASDRRMYRTNRRRLERRKQRLCLLEELFADAIAKVDPIFFMRLKESFLKPDDKEMSGGKHLLFRDEGYTDINYYADYPTIYHLRSKLIHSPEKHDIRLVYLAIHHIIKNRGHFLYSGGTGNEDKTLENALLELEAYLHDEYEIGFAPADREKFGSILRDPNSNITKKKKDLCGAYGKIPAGLQINMEALLNMLAGAKISFAALFCDEALKKAEIAGISLKDDMEASYDLLSEILGERLDLIVILKTVFDLAREAQILGAETYISDAKINRYNQNHKDLAKLKEYVRTYAPKQYGLIFSEKKEKLNNYASYSGYKLKSGIESCSQDEFCKFLKKELPDMEQKPEYAGIYKKIAEKTFLPKLRGTDNGVISYQIHRKELVKILENACRHYPFLNETGGDSLTVKEKIIRIFEFRIPYYVGPLNQKSQNAWVVRKDEKVYPWNFEEVVDTEQSAAAFMENLIARCTYTGDFVLPKDSLLYSEYAVLNEINPLKINGKPISAELKNEIYQRLFVESSRKVTKKKIAEYLLANGLMRSDDEISGVDDIIKSKLKSLHDFKSILDRTNDKAMVEDIIRSILVFGDDKTMLSKWLRKKYACLSDKDIRYICRLKYKDWGRLSKELLDGIFSVDEYGEARTVIEYLRSTNLNLMQLLTDEYEFAKKAESSRRERIGGKETLRDRVDAMYVAPAVRRSVWQALKIVDEIVDAKKAAPEKIFIEVARGSAKDRPNGRTISRKDRLIELYRACGKQSDALFEKLCAETDSSLRRDRLYLYYTQFGKCMYSGEKIVLEKLGNKELYDIDHIFPRSRIKDDSIDNRVLVKSSLNREKTNIYPLSADIRKKMAPFWRMLKEKDLISQKKYERLYRSTPLTEQELEAFVTRQIVETRQSTKALAAVMQELYPKTRIVYSKAGNVSDFRNEFGFIKCREVNDMHHAKDAYLNIVVGNVYDTRFTEKFFRNIQNETYSLNKVFQFDVKGAWSKGDSIATVRKYMSKNNILTTRMPFERKGEISDLKIKPAGKGQMEIKEGLPIEKYGGYNKISGAYFAVIEHQKGKKRIRTIEPVYIYKKDLFEEDPIRYCETILGLEKPEIIADKIRIDALLSIDGVRMNIRGRTGNRNVFQHSYQLKIDAEKEKYIKDTGKYIARCEKAREELAITKFDGITSAGNIALYDWFVEKLQSPAYSPLFGAALKALQERRSKFEELTICEQSKLLLEILKLFKCDCQCPNLSAIGGGQTVGKVLRNTKISDTNSCCLINQSITGLYETKVDLLR